MPRRQPATAFGSFRPGRPTYDAEHSVAFAGFKHRRAQIRRAGAKTSALALGRRIVEPDLQGTGFAGNDEGRGA